MRRALPAAVALLLFAIPAVADIPVATSEGNSGLTIITITIEQPPQNLPGVYEYSTADGTATAADNDYIPAAGVVTIPADGGTATIEIGIVGDTKVEDDETFILNVTNVQNGPYVVTIQNDDVATLRVSSASVVEGNDGTTALNFPVTLTSAAGVPVTASYQTLGGGSATPGVDYLNAQGTITFQPGETTKNITVQVVGETLVEGNENFQLQVIATGSGATHIVFGTITNDDVATLTVANASAREGNAGTTTMTFEIVLAQPAGVQLIVAAITEAITATMVEDYQHVQRTVFFEPGETRKTVTVDIVGDTTFEPDETFALNVSLPGAAAIRAIGTILNDDTAPPSSLTIVSGNNQQGILGQPVAQPLVVEVRDARGQPFSGATVQWRVTRGSATVTPASSTTDAQGRASTNVTLNSVGTIEIEAGVTGLTPVRFTINSTTSLELRAEGPVAVPVARVLDQICALNEEQFLPVCRALAGLDDVTPTLERIAPQPSGAQARIATEYVSAVTSDIRNRMNMLRSGAGRISVAGLSLFHGGRALPVAQLASAFLAHDVVIPGPTEYSNWSGFISGNIGEGERREHNGALGFDLETQGLSVGIDRLFGRSSIVGLSANWMRLDSTLSDGAGSVDTTGYALSVYASRGGIGAGSPSSGYDGMHIDGAVTFGRNAYDTEHVVDIPGMPLSRATGENDASVFAVTGAAGFDVYRGNGEFGLSLAGTWSRSDIDALEEQGSGPLILFVQGHEVESLTATLGLSARGAWPVPFGTLMPSFRAELVHEFESDARLVTARFLRDTLGTSFTVPVDHPDENYGKLAAGLQAEFGYGIAAFIEVTQDVARSDLKLRTIQFTVRKHFR